MKDSHQPTVAIAEVVLYVDDCLVTGKGDDVIRIKNAIKGKYTITDLGVFAFD